MMKRFYLLAVLFFVCAFVAKAQWAQLSGPFGAGTIQSFEYQSTGNKLYAVADNKLYVTSNDGTSWTRVNPSSGADFRMGDVAIDGTTLYAVDYSVFYRSDDAGATWTK